jgi:NAD(P)-dependent dehydrogenase (short-subunit alcohol dehydrogenase family)
VPARPLPPIPAHAVSSPSFAGRRVLITGAARGIGAALARRLSDGGASVALLGLEPELLSELSGRLGGAPWRECDVSDSTQVEEAVEELVGELGGLDVVVANAGIGAQMTLVGGRHEVMERTLAVNTLGVYYTVSAAGAHVSHPGGYVLLISSAAAGLHLPLMGAYCASKAAVEAIGDCVRVELLPTGARVGVAYFAEIDTDMTARGMKTEAASRLGHGGPFTSVSPLSVAVDALESGVYRRARRIYAPRWVAVVLRLRMSAQRAVDRSLATSVAGALEVARREDVDFTTAQPASEQSR